MNKDEVKMYLLLIKLDAESLFNRIKYRQKEYIHTMAIKRTREHFKDVFKSRYNDLGFHDLKHFSPEIILEMDCFYNEIDNLRWYMMHTEDMPATIEDYVSMKVVLIQRYLASLLTYLEAGLIALKDPIQPQQL